MVVVPVTYDDLPLWTRLQCDPVMMAELGGPAKPEDIPAILRRTLNAEESGRGWVLKIIPNQETGEAAGSVSIWEREYHGETITEVGWMVLPEYQRQGLATRAVREVLERAGEQPGWQMVHAFPSTTNVASNALCRKLGFENLGATDFVYRGKMLTCNHWRIDVRELRRKISGG